MNKAHINSLWPHDFTPALHPRFVLLIIPMEMFGQLQCGQLVNKATVELQREGIQ